MTFLRLVVRGTATFITGVAVLAAVAAGVCSWAGYRPQPVLSGSMEPHLHIGSVTIAKPVPASSIRVGDVVTFQRPGDRSSTITHRVIRVTGHGRDSLYETKGDANPTADPWRLRLPGKVGLNVADVPYVGYLAIGAAQPKIRGALIALAAFSLLLAALRAIWRDNRRPATA